MCQHVISDQLSYNNWYLFHVGFKYGFVYTETPLCGSLFMTEGKNHINYFSKILEQLDINDFEEKIITTSFWPVRSVRFGLH